MALKSRLQRRVNRTIRRPREREGSFPFISGDTFRSACSIIIESSDCLNVLSGLDDAPPSLIYSSTSVAPTVLSAVTAEQASRHVLVIHNGDVIPAPEIEEFGSKFARVFSVNWLGSTDIALPIPIGLENRWRMQHGVPKHFSRGLPAERHALLRSRRSISVLSAFNVKTNPHERVEAKGAADHRSEVHVSDYVSPRKYHAALQESYFSLSPPGNGPDCHRTWESIYLGCIPIVLDRAWPFRDMNLPVLVATDWNEALTEVLEDPGAKYRSIMERSSTNFAYMPWQLERIVAHLTRDAAP